MKNHAYKQAWKRTGKMNSLICEHSEVLIVLLRTLYNKNYKSVVIVILGCQKKVTTTMLFPWKPLVY